MFNFDFHAWLRKMFPGFFRRTNRRMPVTKFIKKLRVPLLAELLEDRVVPTNQIQAAPTVVFQPFGVVTATEGAQVAPNQPLFQFVDTGAGAAAGQYSVNVFWGDGSSDMGVVNTSPTGAAPVYVRALAVNTLSGSGTEFEVDATTHSHVYDEANNGFFDFVVTDVVSGASTGDHGTLVTIKDAPLTDTTSAVQPTENGVEGNAFTNVILATFDDANQSATAADFPPANITVNYTGAPTFAGTPTYAVQANGVSGGFSHWNVVATSVAFAEPGTYSVSSVTVNDEGGSSVGPTAAGPTFVVTDAPLSINAGPGFTATEGAATSPVVLATFTDANPGDHTADFSTAITWGDATPVDSASGVVSYNAGTGVYTVTGTHTYTEEGTYFASVRVTDADGFAVDTGIGLNGSGVVVTAATQTAGAWYVNRFAPNGFVGGQTDAGRTGVIDEFISTADEQANRPPSFSLPFYDFQGRQYDLAAGTTYVTMDLYVPSAWSALSQSDPLSNPADEGILASLWGTGVDNTNAITSFPIIAFNNNVAPSTAGAVGFQVFDQTGGFTNAPGFTGYDQWYQLSIAVVGGNLDYYVNGALVYTDTTVTGTTQISNEVLQGYNGGNDYHIFWNPVQDTPATVNDAALTNTTPATPIMGTEGQTINNLVVMTFTDANPFATTADFNTFPGSVTGVPAGFTITGATYTVTQPGGVGTPFDVLLSGTYGEETPIGNPGTLAVTVTDDGGQTASNTASFIVADAPLTPGTFYTPSSPQEGNSYVNTVFIGGPNQYIVATFTDADPAGAASDYTAVVNWGDGSAPETITSTVNANGSYIDFNAGLGMFEVVGKHVYSEENATGTFSVTIYDNGDGRTISDPTDAVIPIQSQAVNIADAPLTAGAVTPPSAATEGVSTGMVPLFTFTDKDPFGAGSDYTVTVNWGDGNTDTLPSGGSNSNLSISAPTATASGTVFTVSGQHTYAEEGTTASDFTIDVTDNPDSTGVQDAGPISVADALLHDTTTSPAAVDNGYEGVGIGTVATPVVLGTFSDDNPFATASDYTAGGGSLSVTWGPTDLQSAAPAPVYSIVNIQRGTAGTPSTWQVVASGLVFAEPGAYSPSITINDDGGSSVGLSNPTGFAITDATLTAGTLSVPTGLTEGNTITDQNIFTFTDANPYAPATDYSAVVTPGDGTGPLTITSTPGPNGVIVFDGANSTPTASAWIVELSHTFVEEATGATFSVVVNDTDGNSTAPATTGLITIVDPPVVLSSVGALPTITEGGSTGTVTVATFTDPGGPEAPADYSASIDWGDGISSPGTISLAASALLGSNVTGSLNFGGGGPNYFDPANGFVPAGPENKTDGTTVPVASPPIEFGFNDGANAISADFDNSTLVLTDVASGGGNAAQEYVFTDPAFSGLTLTKTGDTFPGSGLSASLVGTTLTITDNGFAGSGTFTGTFSFNTNTFTVTGSHTYADESTNNDAGGSSPGSPLAGNYGGVFNIATTVIHELSTPTPTAVTAQITVNDVQITRPVLGTLPTNGLEGAPVAQGVTLATFSDPAGLGVETPADFTATIFWGDGSGPTTGTVVYIGDGTNGEYEVNAPALGHTYVEEGSYNIDVEVKHDNEPARFGHHKTIVIADPPVIVTGAAAPFTPTEGQAFTGTVATFTDPGTPAGEALGDYTANIDWGDGAPASVGTIADTNTTALNGNEIFSVTGTHTYAEESGPDVTNSTPYTITVSVAHDASSPTPSATDTATVSDPPVVIATGTTTDSIPGLFNTGVDANGNPLANGSTDPHYTVVSNGAGDASLDGPALVEYPDTADSAFIEPPPGGAGGDTPAGNDLTRFDYQTTFTIPAGYNPSTASITGTTFADDEVVEIELNGVDIAGYVPSGGNTSSFTISSGFQAGANTLDFIVLNTQATDTYVNVQMTGTVHGPAALPAISEGTSTGVQTVATFTDPGGAETPADYNATINWGDGTSSPGNITSTLLNDLVVNGGFELPVGAGLYPSIPGWTLGAGTSATGIEIGTFQTAFEGSNQFVELNSDNPSTIDQTVTTVAGQTYELSFAFSARVGTTPADNDVQVNIDGSPVGTVTANGTGLLDSLWTVYTFNYTATSTSTTIEFESLSTPPDGEGGLIDDVQFGTPGFVVTGSHTYTEESTNNDGGPGDSSGVYHITTTVQHELSSPTPSATTATIEVDDVPVALTNSATSINYTDFASGPNLDQIVPNGSEIDPDNLPHFGIFGPFGPLPDGNVLELTDGFGPEAGSGFFHSPISTTASFTSHFQFELHGGTPAPQGEGITFTITGGSPTDVGNDGTDLGYGGIDNSEAVGFQLASNTVDVFQDGVVTPDMPTNPGFSLFGAPVNVWLTYNYDAADPADSTLAVYVSQGTTQPNTPLFTTTVDLGSVVGPSGFVGFTGGTSFANSAVQEIQNWQLSSPVILATEGQTTPPTQTLATFTDPGNIIEPQVIAVNITDGGSGYTSAPHVFFTAPQLAGGVRAQGTAVIYNGEVTGVIITNPGSGYTSPPSVFFNGGGHTARAHGTVVISTLEEAPADYTVLVNWGDSAGFVSDPNVTVSPGDPTTGIYTITGFHDYAEEGTYTLNIEVEHENTAPQFVTETVVVADPPLTGITSAGPTTVTEGSSAPILIGTFTDAGNPNGLPEDYSADINFGDGGGLQTNYPITVTEVGNTDVYDVYAAHVYEYAAGGYTLTATIHHENTPDASPDAISDAITVVDPALVASSPTVGISGVEGSATNLAVLATFNDPGDPTGTAENPADYIATVTWDDTTSNTSADGSGSVLIVALGDGNYAVEGTHLYAEEGTYSITTSIVEADSPATVTIVPATVTAIISDVQLTNLTIANVPATGTEGASVGAIASIATFVDPAGVGIEDIATDYSATINWGDGTTSPGTVAEIGLTNVFQVNAPAHTYLEEGTYDVTVTIQHDQLAPLTTPAAVVAISDPAVVPNAPNTISFSTFEGIPSAVQAVATFTDPGTPLGESLNEYAATIDWGDGTNPTTGTIVNDGAGNFTVYGSHTYASVLDNNDTITVTIDHGSAPSATTTETASVANPSANALGGFTILGIEGISTATAQTVAIFTDPGDDTNPGNFSATIDWGAGDGPVAVPASDITYNAGYFTIAVVPPTYVEEGTYPVTVVISHGVAPTVTVTDTAVIADARLTAGTVTIGTAGSEGVTPTAITAAFTDANPGATTADFSGTIYWGDGSSTNFTSSAVTGAAGSFSVAGTHQYAEEGQYNITVKINDAGGSTTTDIGSTTVAEVAVDVTAATTTFTASEGTPSALQPVATFTDPGGAEAISEYTALINWNDGTASSAGTITYAGGVFTVSGAHTYAEEGAQTVTVTVLHNGTTADDSASPFALTVAEVPVVLNAAPLSFTATEGLPSATQTVATFTDPGGADIVETAPGSGIFVPEPGAYSAMIYWGDGTALTVGTISYNQITQTFSVSGQHTYAEEGSDNIEVIVSHPVGGTSVSNQPAAVATVADAPLTGASFAAPTATEGIAYGPATLWQFTDADPGAPITDYTATITWGDGQTSTATSTTVGDFIVSNGSGGYNVVGTHTYAEEATGLLFTVTVTDVGGATITQSGTINVADAPLSSTPADLTPPAAAIEGAPVSGAVLFHFTDANPDATFTDYTATVVWGDGTSSSSNDGSGAVSVVADLLNGGFDVVGSHTYAEEMSGATFAVTVTDHNATTAQSISTFSVADAAITIKAVTLPSATEGISTGLVTVATFTDADPAGTATDYSATIAWGDGATDPGVIVSLGGDTFGVVGSHTYADEGSQTADFIVTVNDVGGASAVADAGTITVADAALTSTIHDLTPPTATEGLAFGPVLLFHFADANPSATIADYTATVTWGDGSNTNLDGTGTVTIVPHTGGGFDVYGSHTYLEEATGLTFTVKVADDGGSSTMQSATINVADAALSGSGFAAPTATEGIATPASAVLWKFTDADPNGTLSDYTATVTWGDTNSNTSSDGTGTVAIVPDPVSLGVFDVEGSHTYLEEATGLTFTIKVADAGGSSITHSATINVADAALTAGTITAPTAVEGAATTSAVLFTFTDANPNATIGDFTATVAWGDGSSNTSADASGTVSVTQPGGIGTAFEVSGSHTYLEEGTYTMSVSVVDHNATTSASTAVTVTDAPLSTVALTPPTATEGQPTGTVVLYHFTDADPNGVVTDYTASVTWGDGASNTSTDGTGTVALVKDAVSGFDVVGSHTYAEELTGQTFSVTVNDLGGATQTASFGTFSVADAALISTAHDLTPPTATEGSSTGSVLLFHFADANPAATIADYTATVTWGDGNTDVSGGGIVTIVPHTGGGFDVYGSHTYLEEATGLTFTVKVADDGGLSTTQSATINVADAALTGSAFAAPTATEGIATPAGAVLWHFTDADPSGTASDYTATITWGDGTTSTVTSTLASGDQIVPHSGGGFDVIGAHTYAEEATGLTFSITVADAGLASITHSATINVADAPLTAGTITAPAATEGAATASAVLFTFTDANLNATIGDFTATVTWGDGSSSVASVTQPGGPGTAFDVSGSHTYLEEGSFTMSVSVVDHAATTSASTTVSVADAAIAPSPPGVTPPVATEGIAVNNVQLFHFTDADPNGVASDYTATVTWGDGAVENSVNNPATVYIVPDAGGGFDVKGSHTYADELTNATFAITVTDAGGGTTGTKSKVFSVADAPLTSAARDLTPPTATEGAAFGPIVLFHFADANPLATAADFTATVTWGDGTAPESNDANVSVVAHTGGGFDVLGSHTYAEEQTGVTFSVSVADKGGSSTAQSATINVADAALTGSAFAAPTATEGIATPAGAVLWHFTDADPSGAVGDYTATVTWGDGGVDVSGGGVVSIVADGGGFDVVGAHTYLEEATGLTFTIKVADAGGSNITKSATINVADAPLSSTPANLTPPAGATKGTPITNAVLFQFTDANPLATVGDFTATVNWGDFTSNTSGDGSGTVSISQPGGSGTAFVVSGSHTYGSALTNATFSVSVVDHFAATSQSKSFSVAESVVKFNTTPISITGTEGHQVSATVATFSDPGGAEPAGDYSASINWGDGTAATPGVVSQTGANSYSVSLFHTYAEESAVGTPYQITVSVLHGNAPIVPTVTANATISDPAVVFNGLPIAFKATEGLAFTNQAVATFVDPGGAEATSQYSATINWGGAGTGAGSTTGAISFDAASQTFTVTGGFAYLEEGPYTISVTVTHGTSVAATETKAATATVTDPAVVVTSSNFAIAAQKSIALGVQTLATFTDPGGNVAAEFAAGDYKATINWGDGTAFTVLSPVASTAIPGITLSGTTFTVTGGGHTYKNNGNYTISVVLAHDTAHSVTTTDYVNVSPTQLTAGVLTPPTATEGTATTNAVLFHFTDSNVNDTAASFTATVSWGDGTSNINTDGTGTVTVVAHAGGGFDVMGFHTYADELTGATFKVAVTDVGGGKVLKGAYITVVDPSVVLNTTPLTFTSVVFNTSLAQPVATFTDPGGAEFSTATNGDTIPKSGQYSALINWGDGTKKTMGTITYDAGSNTFTVTGAHRYTSVASFNITVTVAHGTSKAVSAITATTTDLLISPETISFPPFGPVHFGVSPIALHAVASSGLPVTFKVISGPGKITGTTLTVTGTGNIVIEADQAGNFEFTAAPPVQVTLVVEPRLGAQTITFTQPTNVAYTTGTFSVPVPLSAKASSGLAVAFTVVSVTSSGPITLSPNPPVISNVVLQPNGTTTATLTLAGTATNASGTVTITIEADQAGDGVTVGAAPAVKKSVTLSSSASRFTP